MVLFGVICQPIWGVHLRGALVGVQYTKNVLSQRATGHFIREGDR